MSRKPGRREYCENDPDGPERFKTLAQDPDYYDLLLTNYVRKRFTIACGECAGKNVTLVEEVFCGIQYTYLVCEDCGNHAEIASLPLE